MSTSYYDQQESERPRQRQRRLMSTRSQTRLEALRALVSSLPLLIDNGWCTETDAIRLDRVSKQTRLGEEVWSALARQMWPPSSSATETATSTPNGNAVPSPRPLPVPTLAPTYRQLFGNDAYPRFWLACEMERIRQVPEWAQPRHLTLNGVVECGRCGCNCQDGECGGLPMTHDKPRYVRVGDEGPDWVDMGMGYKPMFPGRFCGDCHDLLKRHDELKQFGECREVQPVLLEDLIVRHIRTGDGCLLSEAGGAMNSSFIKDMYLNDRYLWRKAMEKKEKEEASEEDDDNVKEEKEYPGKYLDLDDVLIVIAHGLVQPGCKLQHLDLSNLGHSTRNDKPFGYKGIKALCLALSINKSLRSIKMFETQYEYVCCPGGWYDDEEDPYDRTVDVSRGLLLKAIRHNKKSKLKALYLCPRAFGIGPVRELRQHVTKVENWSEPCW